ncbi:tetrahydromethanopterin S-methyltransferase subunit A [Epilithonimonas hungarica]|uniref:Tetrahydromethanopterin S-methyltransferase subunit A n=2 Tax=Epilithonimonas hungarica TaxID=454006 RepID=A0A1G7S6L3_9FLAO|nr:tetrahydromethanopterin S-methyltransferase subunit A [Epilithonimonas hungarica]
MHFLARIFPSNEAGENPAAVKMFHLMTKVKERFKSRRTEAGNQWPLYPGSYTVINAQANIAVCTLTSENLIATEDLLSKNVAIIGTVMTSNLGIEKIILNIISNPHIRYFLLCGKESPIFKVGQAFDCLFHYGVDKDKRIINADGYFPVLNNLPMQKINHFLKQVHFINLTNEKQGHVILQAIDDIKGKKEIFKDFTVGGSEGLKEEVISEIKPGGRRIPLDYDQKGFFVITVDNPKREITVKHYYKDNRAGFMIKGHSSEAILLAILDNDLVSQMSHAGYLGAELAKAETAIKLGLKYTQDQSLKKG